MSDRRLSVSIAVKSLGDSLWRQPRDRAIDIDCAPSATRYCRPPVLITANAILSLRKKPGKLTRIDHFDKEKAVSGIGDR